MQARHDRQRSICLTVAHPRPARLQHVLDQVDAAARAVQFVPQHLIGRAGRGAKPAMDAGPQDLVRPAMPGSASCSGVKLVCIRSIPGSGCPRGSNFAFSAADSAATSGASGGKGRACPCPHAGWHAPGPPQPPAQPPWPSGRQKPDQPAAPVEDRLAPRAAATPGRRGRPPAPSRQIARPPGEIGDVAHARQVLHGRPLGHRQSPASRPHPPHPIGDRAGHPLDPDQRSPRRPVRRARDVEGRAQRPAQRRQPRASSSPSATSVASASGTACTLKLTSVSTPGTHGCPPSA
jgi:hypothetical protein